MNQSASKTGASPFKQLHFEKPLATFRVAEDEPEEMEVEAGPSSSETQHQSPPKPPQNFVDSGYHGSQATQATQATQPNEPTAYQPTPATSPERNTPSLSPESGDENLVIVGRDSDARRTTEESFQSAKEDQTRNVAETVEQDDDEMDVDQENRAPEQVVYPVLESPLQERHAQPESPVKRSSPRRPSPAKQSPAKTSPVKSSPAKASPSKSSPTKQVENANEETTPQDEDEHMEDGHSPSEGSPSPIRPIVRKSSLNFASLPAREPITTKKSIGNRVSRSHVEQPRTSYYGRQAEGKSLGNTRQDDQNDDDMDIDHTDEDEENNDDSDSKMKRLHNKTSTQRLQDQISMLGQSQAGMRSSKSIPNIVAQIQPSQPIQASAPEEQQRPKSSGRKSRPPPGAFPEDEEDSWIGPPPAAVAVAAPVVEPSIFSPRPALSKSHTTDVMEGIHGKDSIGGPQFNIPKRRDQRNPSPVREPVIPERTTSTLGHAKSVSTLR